MALAAAYSLALSREVLANLEGEKGYSADAIASYELFLNPIAPMVIVGSGAIDVTTDVCAAVSPSGVALRRRHEVSMSAIKLHRPQAPRAKGAPAYAPCDPLLPFEALTRGGTYSCHFVADVTHTVTDYAAGDGNGAVLRSTTEVLRDVALVTIPAMTRSLACWTHPSARGAGGECLADEGAIFIVHGNRRAFQPQREQRSNVLNVRREADAHSAELANDATPRTVNADIRSLRADVKFRSSSTLYARWDASSGAWTICIPFVRRDAPLVAAFRVLGVDSLAALEALVWRGRPPPLNDPARRMVAAIWNAPLAGAPLLEVMDALGDGLEPDILAQVALSAKRAAAAAGGGGPSSRLLAELTELQAQYAARAAGQPFAAPSRKRKRAASGGDGPALEGGGGDGGGGGGDDAADGDEDDADAADFGGGDAAVEDEGAAHWHSDAEDAALRPADAEDAAPEDGEEDEDDDGEETDAEGAAAAAAAAAERVVHAGGSLRGLSLRARVHRQVAQQLCGELLPHVGFDASPLTQAKKAAFLGAMVERMALVALGRFPSDDRDHEGRKALFTCAPKLGELLKKRFSAAMKKVRNNLRKDAEHGRQRRLHSLLESAMATLRSQLERHFSDGELTVTKSAANSSSGGVIQLVQAVNPLGVAAHVETAATVQSSAGKYLAMRNVDTTHVYAFDPTYTPEGERVGIQLNLTALSRQRLPTPVVTVTTLLCDGPLWDWGVASGRVDALEDDEVAEGDAVDADDEDGATPAACAPTAFCARFDGAPLRDGETLVCVNGDPVAVTTVPNVFLRVARAARRHGVLPRDLGLTRELHGLGVWSDGGVIVFGLLHLPTLRGLLVEASHDGSVLRAHAAAPHGSIDVRGEAPLALLRRRGAIEMLDAAELLEYRVAFRPSEIDGADARRAAAMAAREPLEAPFSHLAPHGSAILGSLAGTVPYANHSQAPRVVYASNQVKQAISETCGDMARRVELPYMHQLWYGQRPLTETDLACVKRLNDVPMGTNELIIFGWWYGMTAEDAIVRNADSVMRGAARVSVWRTQRAVAGRADSFEHPLALARDPETGRVLAEGEPGWEPPTALLRGGTDYSKIGADGAPLNGVFVRDGDVVLGRVARLVTLDPATGLERVTRLDRSIIFHCHPSETYVVDRVVVTNTVDGAPLVRVRMVATRAQGIGDKTASRHGQKGTIGMLVRQWDLPIIEGGGWDGAVPDLIINLCAVNSRMTIGQLIEMLTSNYGAARGVFVDATPFRDSTVRELLAWMLDNGHLVEVTLRSGVTGKIHAARAFVGFCFYMVLRHFVKDKASARARGPRAALTRQPVAGRANQGGLRLGGMEIDALVAHGASSVLLERQRASDTFSLPVCVACGLPAEEREATLAALLAAVESAEASAASADPTATEEELDAEDADAVAAGAIVPRAPPRGPALAADAPTVWCYNCRSGANVVRQATTYVSAQLLRAEALTAGLDVRYLYAKE